MAKFVTPNEVKLLNPDVDLKKIDRFITKFNELLLSGDNTMNDALDKAPTLNEEELKIAKEFAKKQGWKLVSFEDNYQSITYKMTPIKDGER